MVNMACAVWSGVSAGSPSHEVPSAGLPHKSIDVARAAAHNEVAWLAVAFCRTARAATHMPAAGPPNMFSPMSRCLARTIAALMLAAGWLGSVPRVAVAQPTLSHVTPHAVTPGKTTEITLHGTKLAGALRVWTSFAAQVEIIQAASQKSDASAATCKISL